MDEEPVVIAERRVRNLSTAHRNLERGEGGVHGELKEREREGRVLRVLDILL